MYGINKTTGEIVTRLTERELFSSYGISINACLSARNETEGTNFPLRGPNETDNLIQFKGRKTELNGTRSGGWEKRLSDWLERICRIEDYRKTVASGGRLFELDI